ncbi:MAG: hypothetical protein ACRDOI_35815, partial [Trebonia sp.]
WAEGANDVLADQFHVPLYTVTWMARVLVIVGPVAAIVIARRICLGLQRKDAETLEHGVETGIIRQSPDGGFTEVLRPVTDEERAVLSARPAVRALPVADADGVPVSAGGGLRGRLRVGMNAVFTETAAVAAEEYRAAEYGAEENGYATVSERQRQVNDEHPASQGIGTTAPPPE